MESIEKREKRLQCRREQERSRRASETGEEREERLRKRRVRDRARHAAQSDAANLLRRRERSAAESPEARGTRLERRYIVTVTV